MMAEYVTAESTNTEWEHLEMSGFERRKLFCAVMFHAVALTCVVWSLYVLIDRTAEEIQTGILEWPFWTKLIVVAIGFTGGVVFMYIQCKAYLQICQRWKAFNRVIYVQNAPEKPNLSPSHSTERLRSQSITAGVSDADNNRLTIEPSSSEFKPYQDGVRDICPSNYNHDRDETSIDLKGVRNVHIFFNDENRIHVQKERSPSCKIDCIDDSDIGSCNDYNSIVTSGNNGCNSNNGQICPSENQSSMSWHIKIGKTVSSSSDRSDNNDRAINDSRLADSSQVHEDNVVTKTNNASSNIESPVLKLQIKKAEIVIKFGQKGTTSSSTPTAVPIIVPSSANDAMAVLSDDTPKQTPFNSDEKNESSVNIKFDNRENDSNDPIVIDLVQNQSNVISTTMEHCIDSPTPSASSSNPVQIRLDFGCKEVSDASKSRNGNSAETVNKTANKLVPLSGSSLQLSSPDSTANNRRPLSEKPVCSRTVISSDNTSKSEPGSGSQSPLLTNKYDTCKQ